MLLIDWINIRRRMCHVNWITIRRRMFRVNWINIRCRMRKEEVGWTMHLKQLGIVATEAKRASHIQPARASSSHQFPHAKSAKGKRFSHSTCTSKFRTPIPIHSKSAN
jgi:hypothetical protein